MQGMIVDNFAGGGGASTGIEMALGRSPDIAINHDLEALAMHAANHPDTEHLCENVWQVDIKETVAGSRVSLGWFSPDCKHFSKAKGGKPVSKNIRGLAWIVLKWAGAAKPDVIILENVEEFETWGPLVDVSIEVQHDKYGYETKIVQKPCPRRKGMTFKRWKTQLENLGYKVEYKVLKACDYGAPTIRKRLFIVARRDGKPIVWPQPTHGPKGNMFLKPYRTAGECIDFSIPCPSIFTRKKPLAEATLRRIAQGVKRYILEAKEPFIVNMSHGGKLESLSEPLSTIATEKGGCRALVSPTLIQVGYGEREGQSPRAPGLDKPLGTVVAGGGKHAIVAAFLAQHNTGVIGRPLDEPLSTIMQSGSHQQLVTGHIMKLRGQNIGHGLDEPLHTISAGGTHHAEVRAFLIKYFGTDQNPRLDEPMHTITSKDRFGLVMVYGELYEIVDIGMRMLTPRELFRAQGFPDDYIIDRGIIIDNDGNQIWKNLSKAAQVRMCGNSVCPPIAEAIIRANFPEEAKKAIAA